VSMRDPQPPPPLSSIPLRIDFRSSFRRSRLQRRFAMARFPQYPPPFFAPACSVLVAIINSLSSPTPTRS